METENCLAVFTHFIVDELMAIYEIFHPSPFKTPRVLAAAIGGRSSLIFAKWRVDGYGEGGHVEFSKTSAGGDRKWTGYFMETIGFRQEAVNWKGRDLVFECLLLNPFGGYEALLIGIVLFFHYYYFYSEYSLKNKSNQILTSFSLYP